MKAKLFLFLIGLLVFVAIGKAQVESKDFGDVSLEELEIRSYSKDTSADALILFEKAYLEVDHFSTRGWTFKRHLRIKILKQSAIEEWSNNRFLMREIGVKNLKGASYNLENGVIVKSELAKGEINKTKRNKYTDELNFALPNVKVGSVVEFSYTAKSGKLYLPRWVFQNTSPTLLSEFSFFVPSTELEPHFRGPYEIVLQEKKYDGKYQKWVMKDIPAFKKEPFMPDANAYLAAIEFSYKKRSWEDVWIHFRISESFADIIHEHAYLQEKVDSLINGQADAKEKIKLISSYLKQAIQWNGVRDCYADSPKDVFERKEGTSGDINLILASMLEKAGFKVNMILLSTRDNGLLLEDYPSPGKFNYVICELELNEGKRLLLDATDKYLPYDMLPVQCFNHKGFLIAKEEFGWVGIIPKHTNKISVEADLILSESGAIEGDVKLIMNDFAGYKARRNLLDGEEEDEESDFLKKNLWNLEFLERQNLTELEKPLIEKYRWNISPFAIATSDLIYLNPHLFLLEEQNPFKLPERIYPVDFEVLDEKIIFTKIKIPKGFKVEEMPENVTFVLPGNGLKFICSFSHSGDFILVMRMLKVNKSFFEPGEYLKLKEVYDIIVKKEAENIVLKRKS